jgi:phospholipid transport system substrate-binding protein
MNVRFVARALCFVFVLLLGGAGAQAAQDPKQFIGGLGDEVIRILQDKQLDQPARADRFRVLFAEAFDLQTISQFVLGRHWREATPAQRAEWQEVLKGYVAGIYARQFSGYQGQQFEVLQQKKVEGGSVVQTRIQQPDGEPLDVDFRVQQAGDELKIVDVLVANVSLIVTKRSEFDSVIQREGVDGLMKRLKQVSAQAQASR